MVRRGVLGGLVSVLVVELLVGLSAPPAVRAQAPIGWDFGRRLPLGGEAIGALLENSAPTATADAYEVGKGETLTVSATHGVLANDSDAEGDPLAAQLVGNVVRGTLVLNADGSFEYTPEADFTGTDRFTYQAHDGQLSSRPVVVSIDVTAANMAPIANEDSYLVWANQTLVVPASRGVLANDIEPDGDPWTAEYLGGAAQGTIDFRADGSFVYTPTVGYSGTDHFAYRVNDGTETSNPALVTLQVSVPTFVYLPVAMR